MLTEQMKPLEGLVLGEPFVEDELQLSDLVSNRAPLVAVGTASDDAWG